MNILHVALALYLLASLLYWLWSAHSVQMCRNLPDIASVTPGDELPLLTVVVPACNEADKIGPAMRSLLSDGYPNLQVVLVDDRSDDDTGRMIDDLAAFDERVVPLHIEELPRGWLGKANALRFGLEHADGDLILFTDADVHIEPGTLVRAVSHLQKKDLDHLAMLPRLIPGTWPSAVLVTQFVRMFYSGTRPWMAENPKSKAYFGIGAFNLFRGGSLDETPGLEWLRMEIGDDLALGLMFKMSRLRTGVLQALDNVKVAWHRNLAEAVRGAEKGYVTGCKFSFLRGVALAMITFTLEASPLAPLFVFLHGMSPLLFLESAVLLAFLLCGRLWRQWTFCPPTHFLATPLLSLLTSAFLIRTAWLGRRRGGIVWRNRLYSSEELKPLQRLDLL